MPENLAIASYALDFFRKQAKSQGCNLDSCKLTYDYPILGIEILTKGDEAIALREFCADQIENICYAAIECGRLIPKIQLRCKGMVYPPFLAAQRIKQANRINMAQLNASTQSGIDLRDADYIQVQEFLIEQRKRGMITTITTQVGDIKIHVNDLLTPDRAVIKASQWLGQSMAPYWERSLDDKNLLLTLLDRDGFIPGFDYRFMRPDGRLCRYQSTYYKINNYMGSAVRLAVSDPKDWELLE